MARSTYIYVVEDEDGSLMGGFTVKHEAQKKIVQWEVSDHGIVYRIKDGTGEHVVIPIYDFLEER